MFTCYDDQYSFAKESILAIESGNNMVRMVVVVMVNLNN